MEYFNGLKEFFKSLFYNFKLNNALSKRFYLGFTSHIAFGWVVSDIVSGNIPFESVLIFFSIFSTWFAFEGQSIGPKALGDVESVEERREIDPLDRKLARDFLANWKSVYHEVKFGTFSHRHSEEISRNFDSFCDWVHEKSMFIDHPLLSNKFETLRKAIDRFEDFRRVSYDKTELDGSVWIRPEYYSLPDDLQAKKPANINKNDYVREGLECSLKDLSSAAEAVVVAIRKLDSELILYEFADER